MEYTDNFESLEEILKTDFFETASISIERIAIANDEKATTCKELLQVKIWYNGKNYTYFRSPKSIINILFGSEFANELIGDAKSGDKYTILDKIYEHLIKPTNE